MNKETDRLTIRKYTPADFEAYAALMADPEVMKFSLTGPMSRQEAQAHFQKKVLEPYELYRFGRWALEHKKDRKIIGFAGLSYEEIDGEEKIELGYRLLPAYWGKGLAYEALELICNYAFSELKLADLVAIIEPENIRSIRLAERVGMKPLKETQFYHKHVVIYARFAS
jgi:[ribosomal protein S5]-alanine N-acetyltransferase